MGAFPKTAKRKLQGRSKYRQENSLEETRRKHLASNKGKQAKAVAFGC